MVLLNVAPDKVCPKQAVAAASPGVWICLGGRFAV